MEYKKCLECGKTFYKKKNHSKKYWLTAKFCSSKCNAIYNKLGDHKQQTGKDNPRWVGDKIQKDSVHCWVARVWGSPKKCEVCGTTTAKKFEWSNKYHTYTRDRQDWQRLCTKCHFKYDVKHNGKIVYRFKKGNTYAKRQLVNLEQLKVNYQDI